MLVPLPNHERMLALAMQARIKCGKTKARVVDGWCGKTAITAETDAMRSFPNHRVLATHCWRGHELAGANLIVSKRTGKRECRQCKEWRNKARTA